MDISKACGVSVFENEEQAKSCANSSIVKKGVASIYAIYGFFITLVICIIGYYSIKETNNDANVKSTYNNILILISGISIIGITFLSYNYGYSIINNDSVMQVYNQDQKELNSRNANYTSREANVADLIKDRKQTEEAYERGVQNNRSNQNNSRSGTSINFGKGINYNSQNGFNIRF